jgi:hypothetical protein
VAERLGVSRSKAYEAMRLMPHLLGPLRVPEAALEAWVRSHTLPPETWRAKAPAPRAKSKPSGVSQALQMSGAERPIRLTYPRTKPRAR